MVDDKKLQPVDFEKLLESEKKRSEEYLTRLTYMQADIENLKRRFDRETQQVREYGNERLAVQLLDVVDELELALKIGKTTKETAQPLLEGVEMTLKKLRKVLEQEGVSAIEHPQGKPLDPSRHNAVATVERADLANCTVVEEIRKGYLMKGKVLRPSIVKVSVKPSKSTNNQNNKSEEKNQNE
jgi:molecular chaperone GrpE